MSELEDILGLFLAAVLLAAAARRVGAPYPVFLAVGGALLAFLPIASSFMLPPELVLALFVAPVLLDAAYDASLRDLKDNWAPVMGLVVFAVGFTTAAVAVVTRTLVPAMPWAPAIALGAIVAPPDAVAATAVLRPLRPPHRLLTIVEGESLLNDASALLIYRLAVGAVAMHAFSVGSLVPMLGLILIGSVLVGLALARTMLWLTRAICDVPTAIIIQFVGTFGVWILADRLGLSAVLTMVTFAIAVARRAPASTPARMRIPSYAVWESAVFVLNVLAFVFIGLQIRPILENLEPDVRTRYILVAGAVLLTVILVRVAWVMFHNAAARWRIRRAGFHPPRPMSPPTVGSGLVISWSGMRGIVSLAAALALPAGPGAGSFPYRDLIVLTAFAVVLGTLVVQGLTLRPLLRALDLPDDDPVGREVEAAREKALDAALATLAGDASAEAGAVRHQFEARRSRPEGPGDIEVHGPSHDEIHRRALGAARRVAFDMRARDEIGDDAFHRLEEELDWLEMGIGAGPASPNSERT